MPLIIVFLAFAFFIYRFSKNRKKKPLMAGKPTGTISSNSSYQVALGVDSHTVIYVWGKPANITQKVTLNKKTERWYYGEYQTSRGVTKYRQYVDFENDFVVGFGDLVK